MTILPMHEFLLWNNCNNNCKFCWQRKDKQSTIDEQLEAISLTIDYIKDLKNFHILVIGGEIFSEANIQVKLNLYGLFLHIIDKMLKNEIDNCYINTNILYDLNSLLIPILKLFDTANLISRIHFTTSADEFGRFGNMSSKELFYKNLLTIRKLYPALYIIANIILTKDFCNKVMNSEFNIREYKEKYKIDVNTIPYIKYGKEISAPSRKLVFDTLVKLDQQDPGYLLKYTNNMLLGQKFYLHQYQNGKLEHASAGINECGHSENLTRCYSDSDNCFICDCKLLREMICGVKGDTNART